MKNFASLAILFASLSFVMGGAPALADPVVMAVTAHGVVGALASTNRNVMQDQQADAYRRALAYRIAAARRAPGGCIRSKPAFSDADFSFQGYNDADIPC